MPLLRPSLSLHAQSAGSTTRASARAALAARSSGHHPPFPVIPTCPAPSCPCAATPEGLEIDQKQNLNGSMSPYAQHLVISTGRSDWTSKIEDEKDTAVWGKFTAEMKALLGRRGEFHDPFNNILITTSSFTPLEQDTPPSANDRPPIGGSEDPGRVDALLFPSFQHIRHLTPSDALSSADGADGSSIRNFIRSSLLPEELHPIYKDIPDAERRAKTRDTRAGAAAYIHRRTIDNPTILICSHGQRDSRCGVLGPLLHAEFTRYINKNRPRISEGVNLAVPESGVFVPSSSSVVAVEEEDEHTGTDTDTVNVNVGMISHVGGHKWAGNVIVYIPPPRKSISFSHALAPSGIWYGRVEPRHVQGIVEQTLLRGKVIRDLFRGGISPAGEILRL